MIHMASHKKVESCSLDILKAVFVIINRGGGSDLDNSELARY